METGKQLCLYFCKSSEGVWQCIHQQKTIKSYTPQHPSIGNKDKIIERVKAKAVSPLCVVSA